MKTLILSSFVVSTLLVSSSFAKETPASQTPAMGGVAKVSFVNLKDGQTVPKKFKVKFGVQGMKIRPALEDATDKTSGHHHLIIDGAAIPAGAPVPTDDKHLHFGKGQTETEIELTPGKHTLTLQFADGAHLSYGEMSSKTITVNVK